LSLFIISDGLPQIFSQLFDLINILGFIIKQLIKLMLNRYVGSRADTLLEPMKAAILYSQHSAV
jgi:hypothetical protein